MNLNGQDWEPVVIRKKAVSSSVAQSAGVVNQARRAGAQIDTVTKHDAAKNKATGDGRNLAKLENETEVFAHETVSSELKKQIQSARLAKKLTQAQLAQQINEKPAIVNDYESGKAIPDAKVLQKMSRVLGVTLRKNPGKK